MDTTHPALTTMEARWLEAKSREFSRKTKVRFQNGNPVSVGSRIELRVPGILGPATNNESKPRKPIRWKIKKHEVIIVGPAP